MKPRLSILIGLLFSMTVLGSTLIAQEPADDLLAGPSVQDEVVTDEDMRDEFQRTTGKDGMNRQEQSQMRMWLATLQSLDLTQAQQTEVRTIIRSLHKAQEEFQKKHGEEVGKLRKESKEAKKKDSNIPSELGERTRELMAMAPDVSKYQAQAWALLTQEQQASFQKKYQAALEEMKKRREKSAGTGDPMMGEQGGRKRDIDAHGEPTRDRQRQRPSRERTQVDGESSDDSALRRIRFLRRLQRLQNQTP